jgi:hypothetical protein
MPPCNEPRPEPPPMEGQADRIVETIPRPVGVGSDEPATIQFGREMSPLVRGQRCVERGMAASRFSREAVGDLGPKRCRRRSYSV